MLAGDREQSHEGVLADLEELRLPVRVDQGERFADEPDSLPPSAVVVLHAASQGKQCFPREMPVTGSQVEPVGSQAELVAFGHSPLSFPESGFRPGQPGQQPRVAGTAAQESAGPPQSGLRFPIPLGDPERVRHLTPGLGLQVAGVRRIGLLRPQALGDFGGVVGEPGDRPGVAESELRTPEEERLRQG